MIHLPASVRVYLCLTPCDMRKSFDSLQALVRDHLELDAFAGHLFVFSSRRKDRLKICIGIATVSPSGASGWRRGPTQYRLTTALNAGVRSRRMNFRGAAERHRSEHSETAEAVPAGKRIKHFCLMSFLIGNGPVSA